MKKVRFIYLERKNNSVYGGPRWFITFENESGNIVAARTASNSPAGYMASTSMENTYQTIAYHVTRTGNVIIDKIAPIWIA